jgi:hypothetical protein
MINDVDESLRTLVQRDVVNGAGVEISFEAPNTEWAARRNAPTLNLYLYEIREDLERRRVQFEEIRNDEGLVVARVMPPRKFKLSYLVTAWTQRPEDEHRLLSGMLGCFVRFDALPSDVLQGVLADQPDPIRCTIGLPLPPERAISDVWSALGGELKPSLDLVITAPFVTGRQTQVGPIVTEEPFVRLGQADGGAQERATRRSRGERASRPGSDSGSDSLSPRSGADSESDSDPEHGMDVVEGGRVKVGRRFEVHSFPRP